MILNRSDEKLALRSASYQHTRSPEIKYITSFFPRFFWNFVLLLIGSWHKWSALIGQAAPPNQNKSNSFLNKKFAKLNSDNTNLLNEIF